MLHTLRKIDAVGMFVEDVIFDDEDGELSIPESHITTPVPQSSGFAWPKWNGTAWVEGGTPRTLEQRREAIWARIKAERTRRRNEGGFKVIIDAQAKWFDSDPDSRIQQLGLVAAGPNLPPTAWKCKDNTFVTMTPALATALFQAAYASDVSMHARGEELRAQINASFNPESIDILAGWPRVFGE